jgi:hypothetical protein
MRLNCHLVFSGARQDRCCRDEFVVVRWLRSRSSSPVVSLPAQPSPGIPPVSLRIPASNVRGRV